MSADRDLPGRWKCVDPMLCTYEWKGYTAQRTWLDTVALWDGRTRVGTFRDLDAAMLAAYELLGR